MLTNLLHKRIPVKRKHLAILPLVALLITAALILLYKSLDATIFELSAHDIAAPLTSEQPLKSILNSTLGFERILSINLPERTDHRDGLILASALSDLQIEFIEGVHGNIVLDKVLPANHAEKIDGSVRGSWRAHMNAISRVVERGWASALIMEDDVDWDVRLKQQLQEFALASCYLSTRDAQAGEVNLEHVNSIQPSYWSPYGSNWDILWLGHCGMELPTDSNATIVILEDDETVPEVQHQRSWDVHASSPLTRYPQHSRIFAEQRQGTCSLAYAVSQSGARKLLFSLGLQHLDAAFDIMLREWCQGDSGHNKHRCFGVIPQLFDHHRRVGPNEIDSDISVPNGNYREKAYTHNIRWSVQMNMDKLLKGETDYSDQWPNS